jgi:hypothetical protein
LENLYREAEGEQRIPDLALSAGFELFFDQKRIGRFRDSGTFADIIGTTGQKRIMLGGLEKLDCRINELRNRLRSDCMRNNGGALMHEGCSQEFTSGKQVVDKIRMMGHAPAA